MSSPTSIFHLTNQEIFVLTTAEGEQRSAQVATWVMLASLIPEQLRLVVALSPWNATCEMILRRGYFVVHLLSEAQTDWIVRFGLYSSREIDKFADLELQSSPTGLPILPDTCGWAECRVGEQLCTGDRQILIADVLQHQVFAQRQPLRERAGFAALDPDQIAALQTKLASSIQTSRQYWKPLSSPENWENRGSEVRG